MSGKKENVQSSGITRRDFVKGLAIGAAGLGIATILPGGIITAASAADTTTKQQVGKQGDGIYIDGVDNRLAALCQHQGDQSGSCPDVQYAVARFCSGPCAEQNTVGSYFHRTFIMTDGKLFELEKGI